MLDTNVSVRSHLESAGTPIGPLDTQIAAHALSLGVTLVSHGTREFERVPGLNSRTGPTTLSIAVAGAGLD